MFRIHGTFNNNVYELVVPGGVNRTLLSSDFTWEATGGTLLTLDQALKWFMLMAKKNSVYRSLRLERI